MYDGKPPRALIVSLLGPSRTRGGPRANAAGGSVVTKPIKVGGGPGGHNGELLLAPMWHGPRWFQSQRRPRANATGASVVKKHKRPLEPLCWRPWWFQSGEGPRANAAAPLLSPMAEKFPSPVLRRPGESQTERGSRANATSAAVSQSSGGPCPTLAEASVVPTRGWGRAIRQES